MPLKDPEARRAYHREYMRKRHAQDPEAREKQLVRVRRNDARYEAETMPAMKRRSGLGSLLIWPSTRAWTAARPIPRYWTSITFPSGAEDGTCLSLYPGWLLARKTDRRGGLV
jgi:hypothetical protein